MYFCNSFEDDSSKLPLRRCVGAKNTDDDEGEVHVEWALELLEKVLGVCSSKCFQQMT